MTQPAPPHARRTPSMLGRLMRFQAASLVATGLLCAVLTFGLTWQLVNESRNHTLEQVAYTVVRHGLEAEDENAPDPPDAGQFVSQIWTADGKLYYSSTDDDGPPRQAPGWHRLTWAGQSWQAFTLVEDELTIQVAQPDDTRTQAFWRLVPTVTALLLLFALAAYGLLRIAARQALTPLARLRDALAPTTTPSAPPSPALASQTWPAELTPLVGTLDTVFTQLAQSRTAHAHLVARAAHEFRTPLAALKIHAQLLGRQPDPAQRATHQQHLLQAVDRLTRLVNQLLQLAELEQPDHTEATEALPAQAWLADAAVLWDALAKAHGVTLHTPCPPDLVLHAQPAALHAALDNLVHNAIRHSPAGASIEVAALLDPAPDASAAPHACLRVTDHGPGLPVGAHALPPPIGDAERSGLGLAIARRVMTLHQGELTLADTPGGGLTASLRWPQPLPTAVN